MAISSPGVGSGLDINSIVTQLAAVEKQPLVQLQKNASKLQTQLSSFGTVKSQLASLQDASAALLSSDTWGAKTFSSNNTSAITGSVSTSALASSFSVGVTQLAAAQTARTAAMTTTSTVGADGSLSIAIGTWSGSTFAQGTATPISVSISSTDTLTSVASKINSAGAGVSASVVTSGTEQRLLISGTNTGAANGFKITALDGSTEITDGVTGVGKFSYTSISGTNGLTRTQAAQNASSTVEGITVTSSTNSVADAVPGVTLKLLSTTSSNAQITVGGDTDTIKTKIKAFQDAYNNLVGNLKSLTKYDSTTKTAGALQGDGTAVGLLSVLRSMISATGPTASAATFSRLSDVGLQQQQDGTLSTNESKLTTAMNSLDSLKTFFSNAGDSTATNGLARRFRDFAMQANGVTGTLSLKNTAIQTAITRNSKDQTKVNDKVTEVTKRLYSQYSGLDTKMGGLNGLSSFVSSQVAQWNKK
jgi:flagellar hook-associated protein 2